MSPARGRSAAPANPRPARQAAASDAAEVVNNLRRLFKAIHEYSKAVLRSTGLSGPQLWALTVLDREPALSLGELAERLFAHPSTVSGIVDRLEERGHIRRTYKKARSLEIIEPDKMQAVILSNEVFQVLRTYAAGQRISIDCAASELLREALGAA